MRNIPIAVGFAIITTSQFALGIYMVVLAAKAKSKAKPQARKNYVSLRTSMLSAAVARVQATRSPRYHWTHIVCVYLRDTEL
jgi:hypothetical protein